MKELIANLASDKKNKPDPHGQALNGIRIDKEAAEDNATSHAQLGGSLGSSFMDRTAGSNDPEPANPLQQMIQFDGPPPRQIEPIESKNKINPGELKANGEIITNDRTVTLSGTTVESGGGIRAFLDGKFVGKTAMNPDNTWSITFTVPRDGEFEFTFQHMDLAGNTSEMSPPTKLIVDTVAPELTIEPTDGKTIAGTTEPGATVTLKFSDDTPDKTVKADVSGRWSVSGLNLADGTKITATAVDKAGNTSPKVETTVNADPPEKPEITGFTDDTGASDSDGITNDDTPMLHGKGLAGARVDIFQNGTHLGWTTVGPDGTWSYDFDGKTFADGTYTFTAHQTDTAGNTSDKSDPATLRVDTTAPDTPDIGLTSDSGTKGDWATNDNTPTLSFSDLDDAVRLYVRVNGGEYKAIDVNGDRVSDTLSYLRNGKHTVEYYTVDRAGNTSDISKQDINVVDDFRVNFENNVFYLRNGIKFFDKPIWNALGNPIQNWSGTWYKYNKGQMENMTFKFSATNSVKEAYLLLNGEKVEDIPEYLFKLYYSEDTGDYKFHAVFKFKHNLVNYLQIQVVDEFGHEVESNLIKFAVDPLAIDLNNDGVIDTVGIESGVAFDLDGDGKDNITSWVGKNDGFLVHDRNGNGKVDDGTELFGPDARLPNGEIAENPFQLLAPFDTNNDGIIDQRDAGYDKLMVWQDKNQNGISDPGELRSLRELGIESIGVNPDDYRKTDSNNVEHVGRSQVKYTDGRSSSIEGLIFDSAQDDLEGRVLEYSHDANGDAIATIIKDDVELYMSGFQVAALPDLDVLDATGRGANKIALDETILEQLTDGDNTLRIDADANDTIRARGATLKEAGVDIGGHTYNEYMFGDSTFFVSEDAQIVI